MRQNILLMAWMWGKRILPRHAHFAFVFLSVLSCPILTYRLYVGECCRRQLEWDCTVSTSEYYLLCYLLKRIDTGRRGRWEDWRESSELIFCTSIGDLIELDARHFAEEFGMGYGEQIAVSWYPSGHDLVFKGFDRCEEYYEFYEMQTLQTLTDRRIADCVLPMMEFDKAKEDHTPCDAVLRMKEFILIAEKYREIRKKKVMPHPYSHDRMEIPEKSDDGTDYPLQMRAASGKGIPKSAVEAYQESIEEAEEPAVVVIKNQEPITVRDTGIYSDVLRAFIDSQNPDEKYRHWSMWKSGLGYTDIAKSEHPDWIEQFGEKTAKQKYESEAARIRMQVSRMEKLLLGERKKT
jgi:hypothetical protein